MNSKLEWNWRHWTRGMWRQRVLERLSACWDRVWNCDSTAATIRTISGAWSIPMKFIRTAIVRRMAKCCSHRSVSEWMPVAGPRIWRRYSMARIWHRKTFSNRSHPHRKQIYFKWVQHMHYTCIHTPTHTPGSKSKWRHLFWRVMHPNTKLANAFRFRIQMSGWGGDEESM